MSFAFQALGDKDEVIAQLEAAPIGLGEKRFNEFGADLRELLVKHFGHEAEHQGGYQYRYIVKANGHGGGSVPLSLNLTVESLYVPVLGLSDAAAPERADGDVVDAETED